LPSSRRNGPSPKPPERRRRRLYREVGEAIYLAQILEYHLVLLIDIVNRHRSAGISKTDVLEFPGTKKPLGPLIKSLNRIIPRVAEKTEKTLADALEARNQVTHHFFMRNIEALATDAGYDAVKIALLLQKAKIAIAGTLVSGLLEAVCRELGLLDAELKIPQDELEFLPAFRATRKRKRKRKRASS
jgi:hypothetical protein